MLTCGPRENYPSLHQRSQHSARVSQEWSQITLSPGSALNDGRIKGVEVELVRQEETDRTTPVTLGFRPALY